MSGERHAGVIIFLLWNNIFYVHSVLACLPPPFPPPSLPLLFNQKHLWAAQQRAVSHVFQKPLISGQISCNFSYTEQPLIWLILQALDKREGIPVKCRNAAALQRRPSLTPFNLFQGRKMLFLCSICPLCLLFRWRPTPAAGNRKWF